MAHRLEFGERKLEPQGEQQECYPDFGEEFDHPNIRDGDSSRIGPNRNPGQDVAKNQRLLQVMGDNPSYEGRHNNDDDIRGYSHTVQNPV